MLNYLWKYSCINPELNFSTNNAGIARKLNFHTHDDDLENISREIDINFSGLICRKNKFKEEAL